MADQNPQISNEAEAADGRGKAEQRKKWLLIVATVVIAAGLIFAAYHFLIGARHVSTDNAYVGAVTAQVTPLVAGPIATVRVNNTQQVKRGDILVTLDPADARLAVARAEADLADAIRRFRQTRATGGSLAAQVTARDSDINRAQAEATVAQANFERAKVELDRRQALGRSGAVSGEELTQAQTAFASARAQLGVAQAAIAQARANRSAASESYHANQELIGGTVDENPEVAAARAKLQAAKLDLDRTVIRAPIDGVIAQSNIQIGQRVATGTPIMMVVPVNEMYVDANYKEGQLRKVKIGQPARLESDLYGGSVEYHGRVTGIAGGTGSAFAVIPAQNATGNWIKVVQRLPVRITLDPKELAEHPLRVGLSMRATIDVD